MKRYVELARCKICGKTADKWKNKKIIGGRGNVYYRTEFDLYCSEECKKAGTKGRPGIPVSIRKLIYARDHDQCQYCGERAECIDHVNPFSNGGDNSKSNLVACCTACNMAAFDRVFTRFEEKKKYILSKRKIHQKYTPIETFNRPFWHKWVYGGIKSAKRNSR